MADHVQVTWKSPFLIFSRLEKGFLEGLERRRLQRLEEEATVKAEQALHKSLPGEVAAPDDVLEPVQDGESALAEHVNYGVPLKTTSRRGMPSRRKRGGRRNWRQRIVAPQSPLDEQQEQQEQGGLQPDQSVNSIERADEPLGEMKGHGTPDIVVPPGAVLSPPATDASKPENASREPAQLRDAQHGASEELLDKAKPTSAMEPAELIDDLSDTDLPPPFASRDTTPSESDFPEDPAEYLLRSRFLPMTDPQAFVKALTKHAPSARTTESLYDLALATQKALRAWQDEYIKLDVITAPQSHPPKKPCTGGRIPVDPAVYEDMKEAELYGYAFDPKKPPGCQDPFSQRIGGEFVGGRELRTRRARDLGSAAASETEDEGGRGGKRARRAVRRFDLGANGTSDAAPVHRGWGGARKRAAVSETPDVEGQPIRKRGRLAAKAMTLLPQRIQEMRATSVTTTTEEEGEDDSKTPSYGAPVHRRGRPPGSKNLAARSDKGIKKGPRKSNASKLQPQDQDYQAQNNALEASPSASISQQPQTPHPPQQAPPDQQYQQTPALDPFMTNATPGADFIEAPNSVPPHHKRRQRVKSEKRSHSMTLWWAERKAKAAEQKADSQQAKGGSANSLDANNADDPERAAAESQGGEKTPQERAKRRPRALKTTIVAPAAGVPSPSLTPRDPSSHMRTFNSFRPLAPSGQHHYPQQQQQPQNYGHPAPAHSRHGPQLGPALAPRPQPEANGWDPRMDAQQEDAYLEQVQREENGLRGHPVRRGFGAFQ
ncbi:hypothetical protein W97_07686 [Coniosporium apollinis CBS 100218]|uniref:Uncharacterized protein n=1 Tax=Coniosporium apollinis (strain CBS 100218) TaxID=1168221 RepID=R7Z3G7_CONA1|nr:uncharacterized protein W97_07686 [Coniosporium apollinis CBS 100218]EON68476.1 hypothetical protein W97_07686 [Coniosporium apollinis CBS 100218]